MGPGSRHASAGREAPPAGPAQSYTALLPLEVRPAAHQAAADVLQLRELDFELALEASGALREDVEDQAIAIEHTALDELLEIALLARGERVVDEDDVRVAVARDDTQLLGLTAA